MNSDQFQAAFIEEAEELLASLEDNLLEMEANPEDREMISAVFRVMHTIKGSSAMFGFDLISEFTHHVESILDMLRNGDLKVSKALIDHTLIARDHIYTLLNGDTSDADAIRTRSRDLIAAFNAAVGLNTEKEESVEEQASAEEDTENSEKTLRIQFKPDARVFYSGTNPLLLLQELRELGETVIIPQTESIPGLDVIDPETCYTGWDIILTTRASLNDVKEVFIFVESESKLKVDFLNSYESMLNDNPSPRVGEILVNRGFIDENTLFTVLQKQKKVGELLVANKLVSENQLRSALKEQEHLKKIQSRRGSSAVDTSIRVKSDKLDSLVNLVGELVTVYARIQQQAAATVDSELLPMAEQLGRITDNLRENTMSIRMLPIGTTLTKFRRLVRDLSSDLGKQVEMITEGAETELDKTVIEKLNDPLIHIIRNCIDHGIEDPATRKKAGKPAKGTVLLSARHSGAFVDITIRDDGAGLDRDRIQRKALSKGLITDSGEMSDQEIYELILRPGFSTAETITSVSGRGVGMDVVKRQLEILNGTIHINSEPGEYTSISLRLPLTLAIIDGLLVRIAHRHFVFPLTAVEACIELTEEDRKQHPDRNIVQYRDSILPYIDLRSHFEIIEKERPEQEQIVVAQMHGDRVGFVVDQVEGDHQTVIKSLGPTYRQAKGVSGATILGDGSIALILDIEGISSGVKLIEGN